jgi:hypothetical protein
VDTGSAPFATGVSAREAEVLSGVAEHLTNAEIAERLSAAGCRYQWARTLVLAGGPEQAWGEDELAAMGAAPMAPV